MWWDFRDWSEERLWRDAFQISDFFALFIEGKGFSQDETIIALGVTMSGAKVILGFILAATEKEGVVKDFLQGLIDRGLFPIERGLLCVIDGANGVQSAIQKVFGERALVQRCQWHKRENVVDYLPKHLQATWRRKLPGAYDKPT